MPKWISSCLLWKEEKGKIIRIWLADSLARNVNCWKRRKIKIGWNEIVWKTENFRWSPINLRRVRKIFVRMRKSVEIWMKGIWELSKVTLRKTNDSSKFQMRPWFDQLRWEQRKFNKCVF